MSAYIRMLQKKIEKSNEQEKSTSSVAKSLRAKHDAWLATLPPAAKHRHWSMEELSAALSTPPKDLSQTLLDAGWARKRIWLERGTGRGRYLRIWTPPQIEAKN